MFSTIVAGLVRLLVVIRERYANYARYLVVMRVATWNLGRLSFPCQEILAVFLERHSVDVCFLCESTSSKSLAMQQFGTGFWYSSSCLGKLGGVGVMLSLIHI